jgi:hypothetical protein
MNFGTSTVLGLFWDFNSFKKMGTEFMKSLGFVNFHQQCEFERATCWFNPWIVGMSWAQRCDYYGNHQGLRPSAPITRTFLKAPEPELAISLPHLL